MSCSKTPLKPRLWWGVARIGRRGRQVGAARVAQAEFMEAMPSLGQGQPNYFPGWSCFHSSFHRRATDDDVNLISHNHRPFVQANAFGSTSSSSSAPCCPLQSNVTCRPHADIPPCTSIAGMLGVQLQWQIPSLTTCMSEERFTPTHDSSSSTQSAGRISSGNCFTSP
jgi:hypothetical protein